MCVLHTCPPSDEIERNRMKSNENQHGRKHWFDVIVRRRVGSDEIGRNRMKSDEHLWDSNAAFYARVRRRAKSDEHFLNGAIYTRVRRRAKAIEIEGNRTKSYEKHPHHRAVCLHVCPKSDESERNRMKSDEIHSQHRKVFDTRVCRRAKSDDIERTRMKSVEHAFLWKESHADATSW